MAEGTMAATIIMGTAARTTMTITTGTGRTTTCTIVMATP